jgi:hypothetical protein
MTRPRDVVLTWVAAFNRRDAAIRGGFEQFFPAFPDTFIVDGKIRFQRGYWDRASWFGQLGLPVTSTSPI